MHEAQAAADPLPPHGFYPVGLNVAGRRCVVIGDDREAREKADALGEVDADVVRIVDAGALRDEDVTEAFFVIATPQDEALCARLRALADEHKFLLCCIDQPRFGFVAMQATVKSGPVRIAISTGGVAPRVGKILKQTFEKLLDAKFERFVERLAQRKREGRVTMPDDRSARRRAIIDATDGFAVEACARYPQWFEDEEQNGVR